MLRFGPADGPVLIVAPPLFEEANRTRAFLVRILRLLAEHGIASALPDLPGQGESLLPTVDARLRIWCEAFGFAATSSGRPLAGTLAFRAGALVDALPHAPARWRLSPITGSELVRELERTRAAAGRATAARGGPVEIAGNFLAPELLDELRTATPYNERTAPTRTVRLDTDPRPADRKLPGPPLWRRTEPGVDETLAFTLADDITDWVRTCAA